MNINPKDIAKIISEDPDLIDAQDLSKPMSSADIERQAKQETGEDPEADLKDEIRKKAEEDKKEQEERRRVLEPQIDKINKSIEDLEDNLQTGLQATKSLGDLDTQIASIARSIGGIEKQMY